MGRELRDVVTDIMFDLGIRARVCGLTNATTWSANDTRCPDQDIDDHQRPL